MGVTDRPVREKARWLIVWSRKLEKVKNLLELLLWIPLVLSQGGRFWETGSG